MLDVMRVGDPVRCPGLRMPPSPGRMIVPATGPCEGNRRRGTGRGYLKSTSLLALCFVPFPSPPPREYLSDFYYPGEEEAHIPFPGARTRGLTCREVDQGCMCGAALRNTTWWDDRRWESDSSTAGEGGNGGRLLQPAFGTPIKLPLRSRRLEPISARGIGNGDAGGRAFSFSPLTPAHVYYCSCTRGRKVFHPGVRGLFAQGGPTKGDSISKFWLSFADRC